MPKTAPSSGTKCVQSSKQNQDAIKRRTCNEHVAEPIENVTEPSVNVTEPKVLVSLPLLQVTPLKLSEAQRQSLKAKFAQIDDENSGKSVGVFDSDSRSQLLSDVQVQVVGDEKSDAKSANSSENCDKSASSASSNCEQDENEGQSQSNDDNETDEIQQENDPRTDFLLTESAYILLDAISLLESDPTTQATKPVAKIN